MAKKQGRVIGSYERKVAKLQCDCRKLQQALLDEETLDTEYAGGCAASVLVHLRGSMDPLRAARRQAVYLDAEKAGGK